VKDLKCMLIGIDLEALVHVDFGRVHINGGWVSACTRDAFV